MNGIFVKYNAGDRFLFETGANFANLYFYERNSYYYTDYYPIDDYLDLATHSNNITTSYYSYNRGKYSFFRMPLLVKLKTPGRLNFEIGGGAYYAFLINDEFRGKEHDLVTKEFRDENFPPLNDWGWIMASSAGFNVNKNLCLFINGQITTGHKEYFKSVKGKMGATEITFGFGYKPFANRNNYNGNDSLGQNIKVIPHTGINISRTHSTKYPDNYYNKVGLSSGVSLKFLLSPNFSFVTGAWYERKGYSLDYYGKNNFIYQISGTAEDQNLSKISSDTHLDYITFPVGFEISAGRKVRSDFIFGSYYSLQQNVFTEGERVSTYSSSNQYQVYRQFFNESQDHWFKKSDIGFLLGYRMELPVFEWGNIFIAAFQSFDVINLFDNMSEIDTGEFYYFTEKMYNN